MPLIPYAKHSGRVYDVDLAAPPEERWTEAAEQFGDRVHKLLEHVQEVIDDHWPEIPLRWRMALVAVRSPLAGIAVGLFGRDYARELQGISDAIDIPYGRLVAANLMYDLAQLWGRAEACSSASFVTKRGQPVLSRNLDWSIPDSIGEHTVVCRFHRRGGFYTAIGVAGFVGVLSAQRDHAWAVTLNQAPAKDFQHSRCRCPRVCISERPATTREVSTL